MDDHEIISRIGGLADEEKRLRGIELTLDQLWDLLRQRRALRSAGRDPDQAAVRPEGTVEDYRQ